MRLLRPIILVLVLSVLMAAPAPGVSAAGRIKVNGSLELQETYDSNVFLLKRGKLDDFITIVTPTLNLSYRGERLHIDTESGAAFYVYGRHPELNDEFFDQRTFLEFKLTPRLSLEAENRFAHVRERIGKPSDLASNLVQSNSWQAGPVYRTDLGTRSRGEFEASYGQTTYFGASTDGAQLPDFGDARASIYLDRDLTERVLVYTSQEFTRRDFRERSDLSFSGLLSQIGMRWRIGRRLSLDLSGGYNWLNFDSLGNQSGSIVEAALHYTPSFRTRVTAGYTQLYTTDIFGNVFRQNRPSLGVERQIGRRTLLTLSSFLAFIEQAASAAADNNYLGIDLTLDHKIRRHVTLTTGVGWRANAGSIEEDDYEGLRAMVGLRLEF